MIDLGESSLIDGVFTIKVRALSLSTLEEAYQHAIIGYQEPSEIRLSEKNKLWLEARVAPSCKRWGLTQLVFNGSKLVQADIPDNQIDFYWPEDKFNSSFNLAERKQPIVRLIIEPSDAN